MESTATAGWVAALIAGPVLLVAAILWWPHLCLARRLRRPFPDAWANLLSSRCAWYGALTADEQRALQRRIHWFLLEKRFFGCGGLAVTETMRVLIAAQACLLVLNRPGGPFPDLRFVLIYPDAFVAPRVEYLPGGVELAGDQDLEGESWDSGKVILSWADIEADLAEPDDGRNVVLHEFAHQLDEESGGANGAPGLPSAAEYRRWAAAMQPSFERLVGVANLLEAQPGREFPAGLDPYGAISPAEFFAVATEAFFEQPNTLAVVEPEVFAVLQAFYRIEPRRWHPGC